MDFRKKAQEAFGGGKQQEHPPARPGTGTGTGVGAGAMPGQPGMVGGPMGAQQDELGVTKKLEEILKGGIAKGCTEVHLDPGPEKTRVRYRIQGKMVDHTESIDAKLHGKFASRTKVIGLMDISKRGINQKGYGKLEHEGKSYEMTMLVVPTPHGEKVLYRISYTQALGLTLDKLGLFNKHLGAFKKLLERPNGLILMVGPPGSGRTTTCYSAVQYLNTPERNVCSFEPEIRYNVEGVLQGKPEERYEYGYLQGVKATLDLEPDVVYLGDLNGDEVARLALGAAFGRRIVIGRLNSKNGATALCQLLDMGMPGFLVASGVIGVLSQRLVRRLCESCRKPYSPPENVLRDLGISPAPDLAFYAAGQCADCDQTGFKGKLGIFELMILTDQVQEKILSRASSAEVQDAAVASGMMPLRFDGITKVSRGLTTLEEVLANT